MFIYIYRGSKQLPYIIFANLILTVTPRKRGIIATLK